MSRIGKQPISIPKGVTFTFSKENNKVSVKGPKGELHQDIDPDFTIKQEGANVQLNVLQIRNVTSPCTVFTAL